MNTTTPNVSFMELNDNDIIQALSEVLLPRLQEIVLSRAPGHCMRVTSLDAEVMKVLCRQLRATCSHAQVYILREQHAQNENNQSNGSNETNNDLFITSTKLVELRNPLPGGELRPPLLVFLPANLRTSAEDSFGIATFEDIPVYAVYGLLREQLMQRIPAPLQGYIKDLFALFQSEWWPWADGVAQVRFLLTAAKNQIDGESLGASLYELGLVPDLRLFDDPALMMTRIRRNLESVRKITSSDASIRGRVLELGLSNKDVQHHLISFLSYVGVSDPHIWTRQIIANKTNRSISFDKWQFIDEISRDKIQLQITSLDLPVVQDDDATGPLDSWIGQKYLNVNKLSKFNVTFHVDPYPARVSGLDHFTVQILTEDGEPVGGAKKVKAWSSKKTEQTVTLDKLNKVAFEAGWHIVRVLPWTKDDELIPLNEPQSDIHGERIRTHESEQFYVLREGEDEVIESSSRSVPQEQSLEHAKLQHQFQALKEHHDPSTVQVAQTEWVEKVSKTSRVRNQQEVLEVKFENGGRYHILVSPTLKTLERAVIAHPQTLVRWSWNVSMRATTHEEPITHEIVLPKSAALESFLDAREQYFQALQRIHSEKEPILQTVDPLLLVPQCNNYAESYRDVLADFQQKIERGRGIDQQKAIVALRTFLSMDAVSLTLVDVRGREKEVLLLSPTHPLRALWVSTWAQVAQHWLEETQRGPEEYINPVRESVLHGFTPFNMPPTLPHNDGRVFLMVDNLNAFWSLYAMPTEEDTRGLLGQVATLLGLPEPSIGGDSISPDVLVERISRYLAQHPYTRTLSINAFNPGRAEVLAQALARLQKQDAFASLRYDIRLFVPDPALPHVGEALGILLAEGTTASEPPDIFSTPGSNHLFPKFSLAIRSLDTFYTSPQLYRAHLSMLFDLFPAQEIGTGAPSQRVEASPLYGLMQTFTTDFHDDKTGTRWQRQPAYGEVHVLLEAEDSITLLAGLSQTLAGMIATVATSSVAFEQRPVVSLSLNARQRELIHYIHDVSDWVLTIDRNIGIEFFDHGDQSKNSDQDKNEQRAAYLIDYIPGNMMDSGHRLITTSRALVELQSTLRPLLAEHRLAAGNREATLILNQLRALSGRIALKLISSPTHQTEALGLALARLFLREEGALSNQIILPLDAHQNLFHQAKQETLDEIMTLQRTDLALFDLNATTRTLRCNLVEVKCYTSVAAYPSLKEEIAKQLASSEEVFRYHFDSLYKQPDRPDRLLKTRDLYTLLAFYLGRSQRYNLIREDALAEALFFLARLEEGYTLQFTRSALIFDFDQPGTELTDTERGIEFYRIGKDRIDMLLAEYTSQSVGDHNVSTVSSPFSAPSLPSAAFLVEHHSGSWSRSPEQHEVQQEEYNEHEPEEGEQPVIELPGPYEGNKQESRQEEEAEQESVIEEQQESPSMTVNHVAETFHEPRYVAQSSPTDIAHTPHTPSPALTLPYAVMLGVQGTSPQYGILGEISGRKVALDLNQTHTISLFGVQGSGKSYTLGSIVEMACLPIPHVNVLPSPLSTVIFHYSPTQDYKPEFTSMVHANTNENQLAQLRERYGAAPQALSDVVMLVPAAKVEERKREYPDIEVLPITFAAAELKIVHWRFLMGTIGNQSTYIRQMNLIMKKLRDRLTLEGLRQELQNAPMSEYLKSLAMSRLEFAGGYIDDSKRIGDIIRPGRLIIVDVRDEFMEKDEALGLFVVLLQIFSEATYQGQSFNKLVVFDEAHKYIENQDLVNGLVEVVREMRHKGTSILVASQDPPSVPVSLIELSTEIILHRSNSPAWLKHIQKANASLNMLTPDKMSHLSAGEAYVWSAKATDNSFTRGAVKVHLRPRVTQHGGDTKTAV